MAEEAFGFIDAEALLDCACLADDVDALVVPEVPLLFVEVVVLFLILTVDEVQLEESDEVDKSNLFLYNASNEWRPRSKEWRSMASLK